MRERNQFNRMSTVRIKTRFEHVKVKVPPKPYEPSKEERQSHEATHCPFRAWCEICVKAKSPDGKHAKQVGNPEHIPVIEFAYAFPADTPGGPKISMMVATGEKGGQDVYVMHSFQNDIDRLGLVKAELKSDQGAKHSQCGKCFDQTVSMHSSGCDCNAKRLEGELGVWRTSEFDNSRTAWGISRSRLSEIQDSSWIGSCV